MWAYVNPRDPVADVGDEERTLEGLESIPPNRRTRIERRPDQITCARKMRTRTHLSTFRGGEKLKDHRKTSGDLVKEDGLHVARTTSWCATSLFFSS
jgi:hypothetical protein